MVSEWLKEEKVEEVEEVWKIFMVVCVGKESYEGIGRRC